LEGWLPLAYLSKLGQNVAGGDGLVTASADQAPELTKVSLAVGVVTILIEVSKVSKGNLASLKKYEEDTRQEEEGEKEEVENKTGGK